MRFGVLLCLVGALGSGCIFSPKKSNDVPPDKPPIVYATRTTAAGAVRYLSQAWTNRDSVRIDSVYADDYSGSSTDLTGSAPESFSFLKSDEVRTVGALAQNSEIDYIDMDLKPQDTWNVFQYASDPPDWWVVQVPGFKIEVTDIYGNGYSATSPADGEIWIFEFTLRPTYPSGPSGAPAWEIVRWLESRANQ